MSYIKTIGLNSLKESDVAILKENIAKLGFKDSDYRIVEYGSHGKEMKVMSPFLHKALKVIRKTTYTKRTKDEQRGRVQ